MSMYDNEHYDSDEREVEDYISTDYDYDWDLREDRSFWDYVEDDDG